jgi:hypothetical protein
MGSAPRVAAAALFVLGVAGGLGCSPASERDGPLPKGGGPPPVQDSSSGHPGGDCPWPDGEVGLTVGHTIPEDLEWGGFGDGESSPRALSIDEYLDCDGSADINALLVVEVAEWCDICKAETEELRDRLADEWTDDGVRMLMLLTESADGQAADVDTARRWKDALEVETAVVADPKFSFRDPTSSLVPQKILINPRTMTVFHRSIGNIQIDVPMDTLLTQTR